MQATTSPGVHIQSRSETPPEPWRKTLAAASTGTFVEYYDVSIYALVAPTIAIKFFPGGNPTAATLSTFAILALGFLARPFGGFIFGYIGDRFGRMPAVTTAILLMASSTVGIGILPTWEAVGVLAPLLLLVCRVLQSISVGGEYSGANAYVIETAPPRQRGKMIGLLNMSISLPTIVAIAVILGLSASISDQAFGTWGWRIPFLLALPLGIVGLILRLRLSESQAFLNVKKEDNDSPNPVLAGLRTQWRNIILMIVAVAVTSSSFYILSAYMLTYTTTTLGYSRNQALIMNGVTTLFFVGAVATMGIAADRFGRRPVVLAGLAALVCLSIPSFLLLITGHIVLALLGQILFAVSLSPVSVGISIVTGEIFPTRVRYSCNAVSYNIAYTLFGGTAPFVAIWLIDTTDLNIAPAVYNSAIALIAGVVLALFMKETRDGSLD